MDHELGHELDRHPDLHPDHEGQHADLSPGGSSPDVWSLAPVTPLVSTDDDWLDAEAALDDCDGYLVVAVDPQTGEVDAHGPYAGLGAVHAAEDMRATFLREQLDDVVVRIVRWHTPQTRHAA